MWPYVLLIALPIAVQNFSFKRKILEPNEKLNKAAMIVFWSLLLILLLLRNETIGIDLHNYKIIFSTISHKSWKGIFSYNMESGFCILNKFISLFTGNFRWIIIVTAVLSVCFIAPAYCKYSCDTAFSIAVFLILPNFILMFSGLRQAIAISIGFVAFECVRKKKPILFLLAVAVAVLFHTSAFMLIFMYPVYYMKLNKKRLVFVVLGLGVMFVFNRQIFNFLTKVLSSFTDYSGSAASTGAYGTLFLFVIIAVFCYTIPDETLLDDDTLAMRNFLLLSIAVQMFAPLHTLAMRMNYYYIAFIPLLLPKIINLRKQKYTQIAVVSKYILIIFFLLYFFINAPRENLLHIFPYRFFWENIKN